jgi:TolB-like protein
MRGRLGALLVCAIALDAALAPGWAHAEPRVVLLPVVVHSAAPDPSYLANGLADMLAARLEQLGGMRIVRDEDGASTTRLPQALERAGAMNADFVVFGSFTQFGDGASLDMQCARVHAPDPGAARTLFVQAGAIGEIIPKLDDLADKVAYYVLGDAAGKAAVEGRKRDRAPLRDLIGRVDALERAVYGNAAAAAVGAEQHEGEAPALPAVPRASENVPLPPPEGSPPPGAGAKQPSGR